MLYVMLYLAALTSHQELKTAPAMGSPSVRAPSAASAKIAATPVMPFATQSTAKPPKTLPADNVRRIEFSARFAWFLPQSGRLQRIYTEHGTPEYELEASMSLFQVPNCSFSNRAKECQPHWIGWANWSIYEMSGHSTCMHSSTHMINNAVNFGVKYYFFHMHGLRPYLGIGLGFAHVRFSDHSKFFRRHVDKWGPSLLIKSGIEYDFSSHWYGDLFIDYGANWFSEPRSKHCVKTNDINTGGGKFGLGLGYRF